MKICIAGKNNIAVDVCSRILEEYNKEDVWVLFNKSDDGNDSFQRSFKSFATLNGLTTVRLEDLYEFEDIVFLSLEYDRIIKPDLFKSTKLYNIHFSLLPAYKGMYTSAWPILNGEKYTGVTLHRIDAGIDTGDIIDQSIILIQQDETSETLYYKYIKTGTELLLNNLNKLVQGNYTSRIQPISGSTYYDKKSIDYANLCLDLNKTAFQIDCQVRAFSFRAYQMPSVFGHGISYSRILTNKSCKRPGTIVYEDEDVMTISTIDFDIELYKDKLQLIFDCCRINDVDRLMQLSDIGRYINSKDENGWTPLIVAAYNNSVDVCEYLCLNGADVDVIDNNGRTLLMHAVDAAARSGDFTMVRNIVCRAPEIINKIDYYGKNVFDYLVGRDDFSFLLQKVLLECKR